MTGNHAELGLGEVQEVVSRAVATRDAIRWRGRTVTHGQLLQRTRVLASHLLGQGLGNVIERDDLRPWEAGQDFVGVFMYNRPEYIETLFAAFKARCVPYNINYRYGPSEVRDLLEAVPTRAIVYETDLADVVSSVADSLEPGTPLVEVTASGEDPLLAGAISYEEAIASSSPEEPAGSQSPDDLYVVFTGGTTGHPKAVMWRQADALVSVLSGPVRPKGDTRPLAELALDLVQEHPRVVLPAPPFMHGGGQWAALANVLRGNTIVIQDVVDRLDPADIWRTIERERAYMLLITGNAYGLPLLDELRQHSHELGSLRLIMTGAVAMTDEVKQEFLERIPHVKVIEMLGATESGNHLTIVAGARDDARHTFRPSDDTVVLDEERRHRLEPGHEGVGWLARAGRVPLGYLGDADRTIDTFLTIDGVRYSVPGDRARLLASGQIEFLGRDAVTINSGGEKIFASEVEAAIAENPEVYDVVVTSRDHERWGQEVVAVVALRPGVQIGEEELRDRVAARLARYKVPKRIAFVDQIARNDIGKPNYAWAREQAAAL